MKKQQWILPLLGTILLGLSSYVLMTIVELQVHLGMLTEEIMSIDKQIGRIYNHMDRLSKVTSYDDLANRSFQPAHASFHIF